MADDDELFITITDIEQNRSYVFEAVREVGANDSTEAHAEPGVAGGIGPDLASRMTFRVDCVTLDDNSRRFLPIVAYGQVEVLSQTAVQQYQTLRALRHRPLLIAARAVPDATKVWMIETVAPADSLEHSNHFEVSVSVIELIGGGTESTLTLGEIVIPAPPVTPVDPNGIPLSDPNSPTGAGDTGCDPTTADFILVGIGQVAVDVGEAVSNGFGAMFDFLGGVADGVVDRNRGAIDAVGDFFTNKLPQAIPRCTLG